MSLLLVLFPGLVVSAFCAAMLIEGGAHLDVRATLALIYGGVVIVAAGLLLVRWAVRETTSARVPLAILLGSTASSLVLTAGCLVTGQSAATVFVWWSVVIMALSVGGRRQAPCFSKQDVRELGAVAAIGAFVAFWCRDAAHLVPILRATGVAPVWSDYFIHATEISQFGPLAQKDSSFLLAGQPIVLYHYASYMLPAAVASLVNVPSLGLAASLLLPYGILLLGLGVYAFMRTVAGEAMAFVAPFALLVVPDASRFGLRNGFFGFHWLLFTAPGSGYGIGVAFAALAVLAVWRRTGYPTCFWLGLLLMMAVFEFRAHVFLLFAPALFATLLWETGLIQRHQRRVVTGLIIASVATALSIAVIPAAREAWLRVSYFATFLNFAHTGQAPTAYEGSYQLIQREYGQAAASMIGLGALVPVAIGVLTVLLPVTGALAIRRTGLHPLDSFPIWCFTAWLGVVVFAPKVSYGDFTEYQHRPFVLVYAAAFVWTLLYLDRLGRALVASRSWIRMAAPAVVAFIALMSLASNWKENPGQPRFGWGSLFFGKRLEPGLIDAAAFLRAAATAGDTFALIPADRSNLLDDAATRVASLADVRAYLARPGIQVINGQARRAVVERRLLQLDHVQSANQADAAFLALRGTGVRFLVTLGEEGPSFDRQRSRAAFSTRGAAVYLVPRTPPE
jgi:hypothetical protein